MDRLPARPARSTAKPAHGLSGTNLERAGDHNQRVALQSIRGGARTKPQIAALTGLTAPAVNNIVRRLLDEGLILEAGKLHGGRGQPAMSLAINPDGCFSIGLNIDRDHVTIVLLDLAGRVRARATREVAFAGPDAVAAFYEAERRRFAGLRGVRAERIIGLGVAMPDDMARVDLPGRPAGYEAWNAVDVRTLLSHEGDLPVTVENDATAAALGELHFGHGLAAPSFFYLLVTSGLGGGLVVDGEHFRGAQGRSGEIGFLPAASSRTSAATLQEAVSLSALGELLAKNGFPQSDPAALASLPAKGQALVEEWIDLAVDLLVGPANAISCLINPQAIYIGGRLPEALIDRLAGALDVRLRAVAATPCPAPVRRAALAADAPAMGAAILPIIERLLPSRAALRKT